MVLIDVANLHIRMAEVTDFKSLISMYKHIQRFKITVDDSLWMDKDESFRDLIGELLDMVNCHVSLVCLQEAR